jgi:hypothetical protein
MTFVLAWAAFPLVLAALGFGWGVLIEEASGARLPSGALVIPAGLAAAIVVAALLTTNGVTARAAVPVDGVVAFVGLIRAALAGRAARAGRAGVVWPIPGWSLVAALAALLAYGAPVLATGSTTFTGFVTLDDTARWLGFTAQLFADGRSTASLAPSTYKLMLDTYLVAGGYPVGAFMLLGVGRGLVHVDAAWVYQPCLACIGAALSMCLYALLEPLVASSRVRAFVAFVAAQPALLYGYGLWGGIKEMTAAFLLALIAALAAAAIHDRPPGPRATLPLGVATAALVVTFGPGTAVWVVPALGIVAGVWIVREVRRRQIGLAAVAGTLGALVAASVAASLPAWITLASSIRTDGGFASSAGAASAMTSLGALRAPLSPLQIAGIWPVGDFRLPLGSGPLPIVLIVLVLAAAAGAGWLSLRAGAPGVVLYVALALVGVLAISLAGGVPWIVGKALAIASPAVLAAGLAGGAMLWGRSRPAAVAVVGLIAVGVLWSNVLGYHDTTIAPSGQLQDLSHIGRLVAGRGPTFVNDYDVYADYYFLRAGDPVEPADIRAAPLPLADGTLLAMPATADLDSFAVSTLLAYRSIVTTSSPAESRPPSPYRLVWAGHYYELWQRAAQPATQVIEHVPFGDSTTTPYCGSAIGTGSALGRPICPIQPAGTPNCGRVRSIAASANSRGDDLVADERPLNTFIRGDQIPRPGVTWGVTPSAHSITAITPGALSVQFRVTAPEADLVWLGGSFGRGFAVSLDGREIGRVENDLSLVITGARVAEVQLRAGLHTLTLTHPGPSLAPGTGNDVPRTTSSIIQTTLTAIILEQAAPAAGDLVTLRPQQATSLCGKSLDWIEVVRPAPAGT